MAIILEDTRNKPEKNAHIRTQLEALGYKVERTKIYCGDYTLPTNQSVCIDTKQNLQEVVGNVTGQHERFKAECIRAQEAGIRLIILIVEPKIKSVNDVFGWWNPRLRYSKKATTGQQLGKILYSMREKYGVDFQFCEKHEIGKRIVEILGGMNEEM